MNVFDGILVRKQSVLNYKNIEFTELLKLILVSQSVSLSISQSVIQLVSQPVNQSVRSVCLAV